MFLSFQDSFEYSINLPKHIRYRKLIFFILIPTGASQDWGKKSPKNYPKSMGSVTEILQHIGYVWSVKYIRDILNRKTKHICLSKWLAKEWFIDQIQIISIDSLLPPCKSVINAYDINGIRYYPTGGNTDHSVLAF